MGLLLPPAVVNSPSTVLDNQVQPVQDVPCLTLRPFSDAQTSPMLRVQNAAGSQDNLTISPRGLLFNNIINSGIDVGISGNFNNTESALGTSYAGYCNVTGTNAAGTKTAIFGEGHEADYSGAGTVGLLAAAEYTCANLSTGTVSLMVGHFIDGFVNSGGGTVTQAMGILTHGVLVAGDTNSWAILTNEGQVEHRTGSPTVIGLILNGATAQSANLQEWRVNGVLQTAVAGNGRDWVLDTPIGSQIGTSASQKLILWGGTPVVRPPAYTVSNQTPTRAFDEASVSLTTLARVVGTLVTDIQSWGGVG